MKMPEMIGEFRTQMATLPKYAKEADEGFADVEKLLGDFERCESDVSRGILLGAVRESMAKFRAGYADMRAGIERLEMLNVKYTQKLGPRTPKSKDLPGQMKLPIEGA